MSDDRTIYNVPIAPPRDPDASPERAKIHVGSVDGPRAVARLQLAQAKKAQTVQARKPRPRISGGRLGVHRKDRQPKPVETPEGYNERRLAGAGQGIKLLWSAGVQRPSVELNAMRPIQKLEPGATWSIMQYPVAVIPAAAFGATGNAAISIASLPDIPPDLSLRDVIDESCASTLPPDGAVYISGRLIVLVPDDSDGVGLDISAPGDTSWSWAGWPYRYTSPADQGVSWSADIGDHHVNGETHTHTTPQLTLGIDSKRSISSSRGVAIYDVSMWRAAASGTTFADIIRKI